MKIALVGYGKMGKAIEEMAIERGHEVVLKIHSSNIGDLTAENLNGVDVAIEFTTPASAYDNVIKLIHANVPVVCGSTGWLSRLNEVSIACANSNGAFLYASNFSIGVNIFFELNKYLAKIMANHKDYSLAIEEIHHTAKKDSPSGTAVTLANQAMQNNDAYTSWKNEEQALKPIIPIRSVRTDPAPGTHIVKYSSDIDDIEIKHTAHNRKGFALGAVLAAEFIIGRHGIFSMSDVLTL